MGGRSPSPSSTIRGTRATRPTGTRAGTGCSPPILGQAVFSEGKETLNFTLKRGQNQLFRYRVLIADRALTPADMEQQYKTWIEEAVR